MASVEQLKTTQRVDGNDGKVRGEAGERCRGAVQDVYSDVQQMFASMWYILQ